MLPLVLLLSSCGANFKSVQDFALTSAAVKESSKLMADDIYKSCIRRAKHSTSKLFPGTVNDFIGILAAVISMVSTIIMASSTGNPLKLVDLLDQIENII